LPAIGRKLNAWIKPLIQTIKKRGWVEKIEHETFSDWWCNAVEKAPLLKSQVDLLFGKTSLVCPQPLKCGYDDMAIGWFA